ARRLARRGHDDFVLLDLEPNPGGNATSGRNEISAYPWGAHYVPIPNEESTEVLTLFEELGLITGHDAAGLPLYDEFALGQDPMERLFIYGRWQEDLLPKIGVTDDDRAQYNRFFATMGKWRDARGIDGRRAFAIPLDEGSRDDELLAYDQITMREYLDREQWTSAPLRWFVNYCCRDDYGAGIDRVSAWAGIHYFASRNGRAGNAPREAVLTWPEGNGWLAEKLAEPLVGKLRTSCAVWRMEPNGGGVSVDYFDVAKNESVRLQARRAVCATPRFVARKMIPDVASVDGAEYSPWVVANVSLDTLPAGEGAPLCWDNVLHDSDKLGYVVATHQLLHPYPTKTVLTHYSPLDSLPPAAAREQALAKSYEGWCEWVVGDLERAHPDIAEHITHLDVWIWGHGMIRPIPGYLWGEARARLKEPHGPIYFAHSDMSGISIFEEAYTRGVQAADALLAAG
ncbi:MAG TPA: NAD(P)-binding protein, partial [Chthoniobacteraceae bacterium]